jgi:hypothetical protein
MRNKNSQIGASTTGGDLIQKVSDLCGDLREIEGLMENASTSRLSLKVAL